MRQKIPHFSEILLSDQFSPELSSSTEVAIELANLTGKERVIDAYCGIGTIGLVAAQKAGEVIGVELNPDAVRTRTEMQK